MSILSCSALFGQSTKVLAPGAPGRDAHWPSAAKNGFGTSNTLASKVWFTLNNGVMTEVYYPTLDVPNVQILQFIVVSADGKQVETEADDTEHRVEVLDSQAPLFRQINTAKSGAYTITKTYVTDPERSAVLIDVSFRSSAAGSCPCRLYVCKLISYKHHPALGSSPNAERQYSITSTRLWHQPLRASSSQPRHLPC